MSDTPNEYKDLLEKLEQVLQQQQSFQQEIKELKKEITILKGNQKPPPRIVKTQTETPITGETSRLADAFTDSQKETTQTVKEPTPDKIDPAPATQAIPKQQPKARKPKKAKSDLEKFIGENLINKIGIAITIIGVGIGAKYAIDHDMISPVTRIILGYAVGLGLIGFAIKLKAKYDNFSSVLLSGGMAILYFITYLGYTLYDLIPQLVSFGMMFFFTLFTVIAAINYNRVVIANIGLVGAYAVPFLLSDGSGNVKMLFTYMSIINVGILIIAIKRYWKSLYYASFALTWVIYLAWTFAEYDVGEDFNVGFIFASIFYLIFYASFISYKIINNQQFVGATVWLLLANAFIFYGIGYGLLMDKEGGEEFLGLYTLANALIHFIVSVTINRLKLADKSLLYLISGLVLVFVTIAIPVQLDGNWVTLLWVLEAVLMFWLGRSKQINIYEKLSYPLMLLAFGSLLHDWSFTFDLYISDPSEVITPVLNVNFLSSLLFTIGFGAITWLKSRHTSTISNKGLQDLLNFVVPGILLVAAYYSFELEIHRYWKQLYLLSGIVENSEGTFENTYTYNYDLNYFRTIWIANFTLAFFAVISLLNIYRIKSPQLGSINVVFNGVGLIIYLATVLFSLSELRESYLYPSDQFAVTGYHISIRYISLLFPVIILWVTHKYLKSEFLQIQIGNAFSILMHASILWIASSELIHWLNMAGYEETYKLGISILWAVYSLFLISVGIWKNLKYLRIMAFAIFGIILVKLFFYDLADMNTISKVIVFLSVGVLMLISSFLYNKYKDKIGADEKV